MIASSPLHRESIAFFEQDRLRFIVPLKYLHLYGEQARSIAIDGGALLIVPTTASSWDAHTYPAIPTMILPGAAQAQAAQALAHIAREETTGPVVFKFSEATTKAAFLSAFDLHPTKLFYTYSRGPGEIEGGGEDVEVSDQVDEALVQLYRDNGYDRSEIDLIFGGGARSFTIYEGTEAASSCFVYQNYADVWEIAGVHTRESARRKGYARRVVAAALSAILKEGRVPRYQVEAQNQASIQLAESLGLRQVLQFEHWASIPL